MRDRAGRGASGDAPEGGDDIWDPDIQSTALVGSGRELTKSRGKSAANAMPAAYEKPAIQMRRLPQSPPLSEERFIPAFPDRPYRRSGRGTFWFVVCVIMPISLAGYYYLHKASNRYITEFRFAVQDASTQSTAGAAAAGGLAALIGGSSSSSNNNYIVVDYLTSRQAIDALQDRIKVTQLYGRPEIDWWSRFNSTKPMEAFLRYWHGVSTAHFDQITGIANVQIQAFTPEDTLLIANTLVSLSEDLVNKVLNRTYLDAVTNAQNEVTKAEKRLVTVRERLAEYRNRSGVIDPNTSVVAASSAILQALRTTLAQQEAQLATMLRQSLLPTAPTVVALKNQIQSTKEQLDQLAREVAKNPNGKPLSTVMGEYEQLDMERQFAQTMVTGTLQALDQARATAAAQHLYITPYVRPALPTSPDYWSRYTALARVSVGAFVFWLIALMIARSIRERFE
jgi:capsular polysaccharide transport system permease protein